MPPVPESEMAEAVIDRSNTYYKEGSLDTERWSKVAEIPDYEALLREFDWLPVFRDVVQRRGGEASILDCGCGPGHFPKILQETRLRLTGVSINYDTVDPSTYSLETHRRNLRTPYVARNSFHSTIQGFGTDQTDCRYDVIWCIHSLYTIPRAKVTGTMLNLQKLLAEGGRAFIYLPCKASAYMQFYDLYLQRIAEDCGELEPYLTAEEITGALKELGIGYSVTSCKFDHVIEYDDVKTLETYLNQNSLRPDPQPLEGWMANEHFARFLNACRGETGWHFAQDVWLISFPSE